MPSPKNQTESVLEFDDALIIVGQCSKYQKLIFALLCYVKLLNAFATMGIVFIAGVPEHWCNTQEFVNLNLTDDLEKNLTLPLVERDGQSTFSSCARYSNNYSDWTTEDVWDEILNREVNASTETCPNGWSYDKSEYTSTIVSQWDLVCDKRWLRATSTSLYMAGFMVGAIVGSSISDLIGRRPTFIACVICGWTMAFLTSFAPNYIAFCVMRFFTAVFIIAHVTCGFVLVTEVTGPKYRGAVGIGTMTFWCVGMMLYTVFAYFLRDWFTLNVVSIAALFPMCIAVCFIPESPRWLYTQGRISQADAIIRKIAKINGRTLPDGLTIRVQKTTQRGYFWDLWRTRRMALRSVAICFIWLVCSCVFFGLSLNTSNLGGNDFVNFFISGAVEVPSYLLSAVSTQYLGRRWPQCVSMLAAGVPLLCISAVPSGYNWLIVTLAMVGKFAISAAFAFIYVFTAELYPTVVRTVGVGTGSFAARIGGIIAPLINELGVHSRLVPLIVFGVLSLVAGFLALALPETKDARLPETLEDGKHFGRNRKAVNIDVSDVNEDGDNPSTVALIEKGV